MVAVNVSQLLLLGPGAVREFDFSEPLPDPAGDLHLRGPVSGHARLTRTSEGILVHSEHSAPLSLVCSRCLDEAEAEIDGELDEEFFPSTDIRTGSPLQVPVAVDDDDRSLIDEHHEIHLDELLRQNILTSLPLRPLCSDACPGLCATCGERLDRTHSPHPGAEDDEPSAAVDPTSPFAQLAVLLQNEEER
jgi:uncharacterized protein